MKKLFLVLGLVTVLLASCCNNNQKGAQKCDGKHEQKCEQKCDGKHDHKCEGKHDHDCKMSPEMKATFEKWNNWDNLTAEEQTELVAQVKSCIDKCDAEMKTKCEAKKAECEAKKAECDKNAECEAKKAECEKRKAECEAKRAEFEAEWANFDNLTLEGKKALIDKKMQFCKERPQMKKGCCKEHNHGECDKVQACEKKCEAQKAETCQGHNHEHQHESCNHQH